MAKFKFRSPEPDPVLPVKATVAPPPGTTAMRYPDEMSAFVTSSGNRYEPDADGVCWIQPDDVALALRAGFREV